MPNLSRIAEPRRLSSAWVNGVKELEVRYS
jgi:hypothetical protein